MIFPRTSRICRSSDYQQLRARGRRMAARHFTIYLLVEGTAPPRLGVTVSRKVGGAVVRNRVKRLLREYFRLRQGTFPPGLSLSIVARSSAAGLSYSSVCADLDAALRLVAAHPGIR